MKRRFLLLQVALQTPAQRDPSREKSSTSWWECVLGEVKACLIVLLRGILEHSACGGSVTSSIHFLYSRNSKDVKQTPNILWTTWIRSLIPSSNSSQNFGMELSKIPNKDAVIVIDRYQKEPASVHTWSFETEAVQPLTAMGAVNKLL